jgi:hypothetical protein
MKSTWNATVRTALLEPGFWRLSERTTDIRRCDGSANRSSGCLGGAGGGSCQDGQSGPLCQVCHRPDEYYDALAKSGSCSKCPDWSIQVLFLLLTLLGLLLLFSLCSLLYRSKSPYKLIKRIVKMLHKLNARQKQFNLNTKVKICVAFYQCVFVLNTTYSVHLPSSFTEWTGAIRVVAFDWLSFALPAGCLVRGYTLRVIVMGLAPILLLLGKLCISISKALYTDWWKGEHSLAGALRHGLLAAVPFMLLNIFLSVPSVSSRIFAAWACEGYGLEPGVESYFLRVDPSIECDSASHMRLKQVAIYFIMIWAVGVPCIYAFLLLKARRGILSRTPNRWSHACSFLHHDYTPECYWFEMVELLRRLVLCKTAVRSHALSMTTRNAEVTLCSTSCSQAAGCC